MAYVDRQSGTKRAASLATATVIHAAIGGVLILGLAPPLIDIIKPPRVTTFEVKPKDPPPPDTPPDDTKKPDSTVTAPDTKIDVKQQETVKPADPIDYPPLPPTPTAGDGDRLALNFPPTKPSFTPKAPRPANDQSRWVTTNDYPPGEIRGGHTGVTRYRVVVSTQGKVTDCQIAKSSGWPGLDRAVCANVSRRAKFDPGTNESGAKSVETYTGSVVWRIPE